MQPDRGRVIPFRPRNAGVSFLEHPSLPNVLSVADDAPYLSPKSHAKRNTKRVGDISELHVALALAKAGYMVLRPIGENQRYDFVIDDGVTLSRVQVKTGRLLGDVIRYANSSSHAHRGVNGSRPYFGQIEFLAVFCPQNQKVYLLPEQELTATFAHLRLSPPKNNMSKGIRWAAKFELV
jgi:hypothetical protein